MESLCKSVEANCILIWTVKNHIQDWLQTKIVSGLESPLATDHPKSQWPMQSSIKANNFKPNFKIKNKRTSTILKNSY